MREPPPETARDRYLAGLRTGFLEESNGIVEPMPSYPESEPFLTGVEHGRRLWRRQVEVAVVVEPETRIDMECRW